MRNLRYYYVDHWKNALNFNGRANRRNYWMVFLANALVLAAIFILFVLTVITDMKSLSMAVYAVWLIWGLVGALPNIALSVRRLHDTGRSGWGYFWALLDLWRSCR